MKARKNTPTAKRWVVFYTHQLTPTSAICLSCCPAKKVSQKGKGWAKNLDAQACSLKGCFRNTTHTIPIFIFYVDFKSD
jgi:hypothetical protein